MPPLPLRAALFANAAFSALSGLTLMLVPDAMSSVLVNAHVTAAQVVGAGLLLFAGLVSWVAARPAPHPAAVIGICAADAAWVALSIVALLAYDGHLPVTGVLTIAGGALVLLLLATGQLVSLLRSARVAPGRYRHCIVIEAPLPADALWARVMDIGHIAYYAHGLRTSMVEPADAPTGQQVRYCEDHAGRSWRERCRLEPSRMTLKIHFLAAEPDFPFPMAQMDGGWSVEPVARGSQVKIWWEFVPRTRWTVPFVLGAVAWQAGRAMPRVIENMCRPATPAGSRRKLEARRLAAAC